MRWLLRLFKKSDETYLNHLRHYCEACTAEDVAAMMQSETLARKVGQELHNLGGLAEMQRVFDLLGPVPNRRRLELLWQYTGDWRAMTLFGPLSDRSGDEREILRATIPIAGKAVQFEFFDGILCTGEERLDQVSNFDLSIRVSEPQDFGTVTSNLIVRVPWKPKPIELVVSGYSDAPGGLDVTMSGQDWPPEAFIGSANDGGEGRRMNRQALPTSFEVCWYEDEDSGFQPLGKLPLKTVP
jgi:hypothetical protein